MGIENFEGRSSLRTWLFAVMINIAKARGARETPEGSVLGNELVEIARRELENLPEQTFSVANQRDPTDRLQRAGRVGDRLPRRVARPGDARLVRTVGKIRDEELDPACWTRSRTSADRRRAACTAHMVGTSRFAPALGKS
jgi:hypothetical protein